MMATAPKKSAATAAAKKEPAKQEPAPDLSKFLDPNAAEAAKAKKEQEDQAATAVEPVTEAEEGAKDETPAAEPITSEPAPATEPEKESVGVTVKVLVDAITVRPGHIATKGQHITVTEAQAAKLIRLGSAKR